MAMLNNQRVVEGMLPSLGYVFKWPKKGADLPKAGDAEMTCDCEATILGRDDQKMKQRWGHHMTNTHDQNLRMYIYIYYT